jgi:3-hydroxyacyl-[acyl-carrier-protein] dehydratase
MRFLLVDRLTSLEVGKRVEGYKCWSLADDVFDEHFPGTPIVPGVLLVESMAQMVGFLLHRSYVHEFGDDAYVGAILSIIHKAKFRRLVEPGDRVDMDGELLAMDRTRASCRVRASVRGEERATADLSFVWHVRQPEELPPELLMQRRSYERFVFAGLESQAGRVGEATGPA